jgi:hypothetical protein
MLSVNAAAAGAPAGIDTSAQLRQVQQALRGTAQTTTP